MPQLGYGVYQVEPDECERYVVNALSVGSIGRRPERLVHQLSSTLNLMQKIAALDTAHSLFLDHHSGETTKQFMEWRAVVKLTE